MQKVNVLKQQNFKVTKLEVVKQEMAKVNINILGITELKWTVVGECNSYDNYIYTVGKNPLEEME